MLLTRRPGCYFICTYETVPLSLLLVYLSQWSLKEASLQHEKVQNMRKIRLKWNWLWLWKKPELQESLRGACVAVFRSYQSDARVIVNDPLPLFPAHSKHLGAGRTIITNKMTSAGHATIFSFATITTRQRTEYRFSENNNTRKNVKVSVFKWSCYRNIMQ